MGAMTLLWQEAVWRLVDRWERQAYPRRKPLPYVPPATGYGPGQSRASLEGDLPDRRRRERCDRASAIIAERGLLLRMEALNEQGRARRSWASWRIWSALWGALGLNAPSSSSPPSPVVLTGAIRRPSWLMPRERGLTHVFTSDIWSAGAANQSDSDGYIKARARIVVGALAAWGFTAEQRPVRLDKGRRGPARYHGVDLDRVEIWANVPEPKGLAALLTEQIELLWREFYREELYLVSGAANLKVIYGPSEPNYWDGPRGHGRGAGASK